MLRGLCTEQGGCLGALGALGCSWQPASCLFSSLSLPVCAGRLREAELFALGVPAEAGQGSPCPALELVQEAVMLLGWLGPGSWGATAPSASIPLLQPGSFQAFPAHSCVAATSASAAVFVGTQRRDV